jgi:hypothetical protein
LTQVERQYSQSQSQFAGSQSQSIVLSESEFEAESSTTTTTTTTTKRKRRTYSSSYTSDAWPNKRSRISSRVNRMKKGRHRHRRRKAKLWNITSQTLSQQSAGKNSSQPPEHLLKKRIHVRGDPIESQEQEQ